MRPIWRNALGVATVAIVATTVSTDESPAFVNGVLGQVMLVTPQIRAAAEAVRGTSDGS